MYNKMLPATFVTLATFLLKLCTSSPVYNMQPAYITANIGTTGRNIRNLPCISRKTNQSGVCMFAIDCLKSNGTHLGTCIDRFYFGSCCRIEPLNDLLDNTIDSIIPVREPPSRLTSTTEKIKTTIGSTVKTTKIPQKIGTTAKRKPSTTTVVYKTVATTVIPVHKVVENVSSTTKKPTTAAKIENVTEIPQKLSTFQSVANQITTTQKPKTTTKPTKVPSKPAIIKPITKPVVSNTPKPTQSRPKPKPTVKPVAQNGTKPSVKPTRPKPVRPAITTQKPQKTTKLPLKPSKNTTKPVRITTTRKPPTVTKISTLSENTTVKVTRRPVTTIKPIVTTTKLPYTTTTITKKPNVTVSVPPKLPEIISTIGTTIKPLNSTISNKIPVTKLNTTSSLQNVTGNLENNEIETVKPTSITVESTTKGTLITWAVVDEKNTTKPANGSTNEGEEWVPITTPDGWVLLPSVPATTPASIASSAVNTTLYSSSTTSSPITPLVNISLQTEASIQTTTEILVMLNVTTTKTNVTATTEQPSSHDHPVNMSDFTDVCGRRMYPEARIVGGEKSSFGKWPWQISLRQWRTSTYLHKCGAALLNENWAITAAHCVDNVPPSDLLLRLGEHDLSTEAEPYLHQERRVQIVASHPQFDPRTFEYDLALLRFYEPVNFQPNIIPVCVPQNDENFVGRTAYVTGWGRLYEDGPLPSILQEVSVPVINNTVCESMYRSAGYIEHIPHIFICAGWRRGGFDSCEGDSGGPMVIQRPDKRFLLAGVISWGIGCAEPNQPGVYTRISEFRDWINQILQF